MHIYELSNTVDKFIIADKNANEFLKLGFLTILSNIILTFCYIIFHNLYCIVLIVIHNPLIIIRFELFHYFIKLNFNLWYSYD